MLNDADGHGGGEDANNRPTVFSHDHRALVVAAAITSPDCSGLVGNK